MLAAWRFRTEAVHQVPALQVDEVREVLRGRGRDTYKLPAILAGFVQELLNQEYLIAVLDVELSNHVFPLHVLTPIRSMDCEPPAGLSGAARSYPAFGTQCTLSRSQPPRGVRPGVSGAVEKREVPCRLHSPHGVRRYGSGHDVAGRLCGPAASSGFRVRAPGADQGLFPVQFPVPRLAVAAMAGT